MRKCPYCEQETQQHSVGKTAAGSQRYRCGHCKRKYTPVPKEAGYPQAVRDQAVRLYVDGMNFRRIARQLGVNHQIVINWINGHIASLPDQTAQPSKVTTIEMDELFTYVGKKKTKST